MLIIYITEMEQLQYNATEYGHDFFEDARVRVQVLRNKCTSPITLECNHEGLEMWLLWEEKILNYY